MSPRVYSVRWPVRTRLGIGSLGEIAELVPPGQRFHIVKESP
jgi:hypothetical protein